MAMVDDVVSEQPTGGIVAQMSAAIRRCSAFMA